MMKYKFYNEGLINQMNKSIIQMTNSIDKNNLYIKELETEIGDLKSSKIYKIMNKIRNLIGQGCKTVQKRDHILIHCSKLYRPESFDKLHCSDELYFLH